MATSNWQIAKQAIDSLPASLEGKVNVQGLNAEC
jgi:hypothetical protein